VSALELALRNLTAWSVQAAALGLAAFVLMRLLPVERPAARSALAQSLLALVLALPLLQPWSATAATVSWRFALVPTGPLAPGSVPTAASAPGAMDWPLALAGFLALGATLRLGRLGLGLVRLRALRRRARPLDAPPWLLTLKDALSPRTRFLTSPDAALPATFGLFRPVVLLPDAWHAMERDRQEAVALHELLHARRGDWLPLLLEELVKALMFFHPTIHWLVGRVRLAREQVVDSRVVERLGGRAAYLDSLVEVARFAALARAVPAAPFLRESHLRERVDLLLKGVAMSRVRALAHASLTVLALVLVAAWVVSAAPLHSSATASPAMDLAEKPFEPKIVHKVNPAYPADAKKDGVQGIFLIDVTIDETGAISKARVVASSPDADREGLLAKKGTPGAVTGDERLAEAALTAVRQWRYEPVIGPEGRPVDAEATVTVRFVLQ
jgi:beta-lactamase regulating signal transducer with metallopeptidase domain